MQERVRILAELERLKQVYQVLALEAREVSRAEGAKRSLDTGGREK